MTNEESESVEATPEAAPEGEATAVAESEAPADEAPEAPVAVEAATDAPKKNTGLIAGAAALAVIAIAGWVVATLALTGVFKADPGDPSTVVKNFFGAKTCKTAQDQLSKGYWAGISSRMTTSCKDSDIASQFSGTKIAVKSKKVTDNNADVVVSATSTATATAPSQTAEVDVYLVNVDGHWKIDQIVGKSS